MALPRIIVSSEPTVYHVVTRVSRGEFLFGDLEKERMRKMIWQMADFCGWTEPDFQDADGNIQ